MTEHHGPRRARCADGVLTCPCGNTPHQDGFEPCTSSGLIWPPSTTWDSHCRCSRCRCIIDTALRYTRGPLARLLRLPDVRTIDGVPINALTCAVTWSLLIDSGPQDVRYLAQSIGWGPVIVVHVLEGMFKRRWLELGQERGPNVFLSPRGFRHGPKLFEIGIAPQ